MSLIHNVRILCGKKMISSHFIKRALLHKVRIIITKNEIFIDPPMYHIRRYATDPVKNNDKLNQEIVKNINSQLYEEAGELKKESTERLRFTIRCFFIIFCSVLSVAIVTVIYTLVSPDTDEFGNEIEDEFSTLPIIQRFFYRLLREIDYVNKMMTQPCTNKLLPDINLINYNQPKYTIIIELHDLLVHADWTYQTGWRFKRRPDVDKFLELLSLPMFELVVFTATEPCSTSQSLVEALDPNNYITYKLGKESTQFSDGQYVKNLDYLNRDLSKVVVVDWNEKSVKFHRNNAIILPRWTGEDDDKMLIDLAMFLRTIAANDVEDVREVLSYYSQFGNPIHQFRENQRKLLEHMEEREEIERKKESSLASKWANIFQKNSNRFDIK